MKECTNANLFIIHLQTDQTHKACKYSFNIHPNRYSATDYLVLRSVVHSPAPWKSFCSVLSLSRFCMASHIPWRSISNSSVVLYSQATDIVRHNPHHSTLVVILKDLVIFYHRSVISILMVAGTGPIGELECTFETTEAPVAFLSLYFFIEASNKTLHSIQTSYIIKLSISSGPVSSRAS